MVALAVAQGGLLLLQPSVPLIALGLWWNANTISHNFVHRAFFRWRALNVLFSCYLTLLLGIPQAFWRARHLAHHAGIQGETRLTRPMAIELGLVLTLWGMVGAWAPAFFLTVYLPGYLLGLSLCCLHGRYEHVHGTISYYGGLYNLLFLNDGYHAEHHARPGEHWTRLPTRIKPEANISQWPAVLRWIEPLIPIRLGENLSPVRRRRPEGANKRNDKLKATNDEFIIPHSPFIVRLRQVILIRLERLVRRSQRLQRFVLRNHERAFRKLLPKLPAAPRIGIVGGGLFPRTALILQRMLPEARLVLIDASAENLQAARALVSGNVEFVNAFYHASWPEKFDLLVIPLSYLGDRSAIYRDPPAPAILVHDWIWRRCGVGAVVSLSLLKRLNLVKP